MTWRQFQAAQRLATIGDRFLSYVDQGAGNPVILLHGIPTWGYLWHGVLPTLAERHRVLVPDLLGFGYSDRSDRFDRSIAVQADAIERWMIELRVESATVVGHDIGGGVALRLATLAPRRVSRLCLIDTVCYDSWPSEMLLPLGRPESSRKLSAPEAVRLLRRALADGFASHPDPDLLDGLVAPYATEVGKLSLIRNVAALNTNHTTELTPHLPQIAVPTFILWGEDDRFQPVRYAERLANDIPGARLYRVERARHFVMFDRPDEVRRRLRGFLDIDVEARAA